MQLFVIICTEFHLKNVYGIPNHIIIIIIIKQHKLIYCSNAVFVANARL